MAGETFIKGNAVILSIHQGTAYEPIACLTSNSISEAVAVDEVETKCDPGNIVKSAGAFSYDISGDGIYIDESVDTARQSHAKLKALLRAKTVINWRMATGLASAAANEYGTGLITALDLTGEAGSNATFTFTISGRGAISATDPLA